MVTGVETASLVLAVVPLIIYALDNYENAIGPTKAFIKWKGNIAKAKHELYVLYAAYDQILRVLLRPVISKDDLQIMIEDMNSENWKQGKISEDLRCYLGASYLAVTMEIEQIAKDLLEIATHLNLNPAQPLLQPRDLRSITAANPPISSSVDPRKKYDLRQRIKFTMKRQDLKVRMDSLQKSLDRLAGFVVRAEKLEPEQTTSKRSATVKFLAPLQSIRENASRVHQALLSNWCTLHTMHCAAILLEDRMRRYDRGCQPVRTVVSNSNAADCFSLCVAEHSITPEWLSTEFRVVEQPKCNISIVTTSVMLPGDTSPFLDPTKLDGVAEICSYLKQKPTPLVGFCFYDHLHLSAYPGSLSQAHQRTQGVTLTQTLPQLSYRLASGDIYRLAIILTATVLQLIETPWMEKAWNKDVIVFTRTCSKLAGNVDIKYPSLLKEFPSSGFATPLPDPRPASRAQSALLSLGIMLLEINSGKSLESVRMPQDLGSTQTVPDIESDFKTARRWLADQEHQGVISFGFSTAITSCVQAYCNPRADASDPVFATHVQDTVIKPLESEMQGLLHGWQLS